MNPWSRLLQTLPQLCLFVTLAFLLALAELSPKRFERLMQEDGWAEWATFSAFALAAVLGFRHLWRMRRPASAHAPGVLPRLALFGLALFCLFVAGEEISWGQRLIGFRPASLFLENNYQQESNLHNLLKDVLDTRWMVFLVCVSYGVLAPYAAHVLRFPSTLAAPLALLPWFAVVGWLEFSYPYELVGELAELMLGLLFLTDVLARTQQGEAAQALDRAPAARPYALAQLAVLAVPLGILPATDLLMRLNADTLIAHTRDDLAVLAERIERGAALRAKVFRMREVHKRVYTAVKAGYLELDPDEFYLDAWNNPYWIAFERKRDGRGSVVLYSFGPNRRRELDPKRPDAPAPGSDDVKIVLEVTAPARAAL